MSRHPQEAADIFTAMKGKNFMTPDPVKYGWIGDLAFEIAEGQGFKRELIVGVSFREADGTLSDRARAWSVLFNEGRDVRMQAVRYIDELRKEVRT